MKIAITINDVLRVFYKNFEEIYNIYLEEEDIDYVTAEGEDSFEEECEFTESTEQVKKQRKLLHLNGVIDPMHLTSNFEFENQEEFETFLYSQMAFEIFSKSIITYKNAFVDLQKLEQFFVKNGDTLEVISLEKNNSKPATLFFLAREKCKLSKLTFFSDYLDVWNHYDVIITADNYLIQEKPKNNKQLYKINSPSNLNLNTTYTFNDIKELNDFLINEQTIN